MKSDLIRAMEDVVTLLRECSNFDKANWFYEKINLIQGLDEDTNNFKSAISEIEMNLVGMGSLSDISLRPTKDSQLSFKQAAKIQWLLVDKIGCLIRGIT